MRALMSMDLEPETYPPIWPREKRQTWRRAVEKAEALIERDELGEALLRAREAAEAVEGSHEANRFRRTARALLAVSDWRTHAHMIALAERLDRPEGPPEWDGRPIGTLVINRREPIHISKPIRFAWLLGAAKARVERCILLTDPRLVPLLRRGFPDVDIRGSGPDDDETIAGADALAGFHTLVRLFGFDDRTIRAGFRPLQADPLKTQEFRARYSQGPLIGISWSSINPRKTLPSLVQWAKLLREVDATYVSLQYGDVAADIAELSRLSGRNVIHDRSVDSLLDLDLYAAQVAAMHAVVSVSNSGAHMAGALGVRTIVIVDEIREAYLSWPLRGDITPWYPSLTVLQKGSRDWDEAFSSVRTAAKECIR
jgi:hypothetical protein